MRERPILFNTEMITAILSGQKTQTRRVVKTKTLKGLEVGVALGECFPLEDDRSKDCTYIKSFCPFGEVGDRLWVRETFCYGRIDEWDAEHPLDRHLYVEQTGRANEDHPVHKQWCLANGADTEDVVWKPSIHMPRSACRLILEITAIRIERLNDISVEDALSEGIQHRTMNCPRHEFFQLWNSVYGEMSHEQNPWVWVIEFNLVEDGEHDF